MHRNAPGVGCNQRPLHPVDIAGTIRRQQPKCRAVGNTPLKKRAIRADMRMANRLAVYVNTDRQRPGAAADHDLPRNRRRTPGHLHRMRSEHQQRGQKQGKRGVKTYHVG